MKENANKKLDKWLNSEIDVFNCNDNCNKCNYYKELET